MRWQMHHKAWHSMETPLLLTAISTAEKINWEYAHVYSTFAKIEYQTIIFHRVTDVTWTLKLCIQRKGLWLLGNQSTRKNCSESSITGLSATPALGKATGYAGCENTTTDSCHSYNAILLQTRKKFSLNPNNTLHWLRAEKKSTLQLVTIGEAVGELAWWHPWWCAATDLITTFWLWTNGPAPYIYQVPTAYSAAFIPCWAHNFLLVNKACHNRHVLLEVHGITTYTISTSTALKWLLLKW